MHSAKGTGLAEKTGSQPGLPIIDVSGLRHGDRSRRADVADAIRTACLDKGFFYITGHGVAENLIKSIFAEAARFFALPLESKMALDKARSKANRGYEPLAGQRLEAGTPPDLKESFFIGEDAAASDPRVLAGQFGRGPNQWPKELPGFKSAVAPYFAEMRKLGALMYGGLALSLGLDETYFDAFYGDPLNTLRMIHYPPQPANPEPDQKGCGAHTDFGGITLLLQDAVGGLQVWDSSDGWIDARPVEGTFVVNLGDFVSLWTNNKYRSTLHRVINSSGRERYSIPFFVNGDPDFSVSCIPICLDPGETPKFAATTIAEHFTAMYRKTYLQ